MIYAYRSENATEVQSYEGHIEDMLKCWEKIRRKYQKTLERVLKLDAEKIDFLVKAMIILHDSGKCTEFYQDVISRNESVGRYRHEIVSAYLAYEMLKNTINEPYPSIISATILLHHEPILMGCVSTQREKGVTLTDIRGRIEYPRVDYGAREKAKTLHPEFNELFKYLFDKYLKVELNLDIDEVNSDYLVETVGRVIALTSLSGDDSWKQEMRSMVALLLYILVVCDYYGSRNRRGDEPRFAKEIEWEWGDFE